MAVTFGYYKRENNPEYLEDPDVNAYIYTLIREISPIEIMTISVKSSMNSQTSVVGERPEITPIGIDARIATIRAKFASGTSKSLISDPIPERVDDNILREGYCLRVHKDPGYSAYELVNFNITKLNDAEYWKSYPFYTTNKYTRAAYWTIETYQEDQNIKQKFGRIEFNLTLKYNWIWQGESLWQY